MLGFRGRPDTDVFEAIEVEEVRRRPQWIVRSILGRIVRKTDTYKEEGEELNTPRINALLLTLVLHRG